MAPTVLSHDLQNSTLLPPNTNATTNTTITDAPPPHAGAGSIDPWLYAFSTIVVFLVLCSIVGACRDQTPEAVNERAERRKRIAKQRRDIQLARQRDAIIDDPYAAQNLPPGAHGIALRDMDPLPGRTTGPKRAGMPKPHLTGDRASGNRASSSGNAAPAVRPSYSVIQPGALLDPVPAGQAPPSYSFFQPYSFFEPRSEPVAALPSRDPMTLYPAPTTATALSSHPPTLAPSSGPQASIESLPAYAFEDPAPIGRLVEANARRWELVEVEYGLDARASREDVVVGGWREEWDEERSGVTDEGRAYWTGLRGGEGRFGGLD